MLLRWSRIKVSSSGYQSSVRMESCYEFPATIEASSMQKSQVTFIGLKISSNDSIEKIIQIFYWNKIKKKRLNEYICATHTKNNR